MRILLLSQWYDPEPNTKAHTLAKELIHRGHCVSVITGYPNYPEGKIYQGYKIRPMQIENMDGVKVIRVPLFPSHDQSLVRRSLNFISFALSCCLIGPFIVKSYDILWAYHPPLTIGTPALWFNLLFKIPFVYEIQDMWPETLISTGAMHEGLITRTLGAISNFIYRKAAAISVISPGFKRNLIEKGVPQEKIHVISNWADQEIYRPVPRDEVLAEKFGLNGKFNVIFGGNIGAAQGLENVVKAASKIADLKDLNIIFIGDGIDNPRLQKITADMGLINIKFIGRQPAENMPFFFALADVLLVHLKDDPLFHITIPSKILSYLACGRPIICVVPGDGADLINQARAGIVCPPDNSDALADTFRQFYAMSKEDREKMGLSGLSAFKNSFTRQKLIDHYESLFKDILSI